MAFVQADIIREAAKRQNRNSFLVRAMILFLQVISLIFFPLLAIYLLLAGVVGPGIFTDPPNYVFLIVSVLIYGSYFIFPFLLALPVLLPLAYRNKNMDRIIVFRKFHDRRSEKAIRKIVKSSLGAYGHVFTLSDSKIKVKWYTRIPILLGQMGFFDFRQRKITNDRHLTGLKQSLGRKKWLNLNWLVSASKIFPIRTTDEYWQATARLLLTESKLVVIDISKVTEAMQWELQTVQEMGLLPNVLLIASDEDEAGAGEWRRKMSAAAQRDIPLFFFNEKGKLQDQSAFIQRVSEVLARHRSGEPPAVQEAVLKRTLITSGSLFLIYFVILFLMGPPLFPKQFGKYSPFPRQVMQAYLNSFWKTDNTGYVDQIAARARKRWPEKMASSSITSALDHHESECEGVHSALLDFAYPPFYDQYLELIKSGEPKMSDAAFDILKGFPKGIPREVTWQLMASDRVGVKEKGFESLVGESITPSLLDTVINLMIAGEGKIRPDPEQHNPNSKFLQLLSGQPSFQSQRLRLYHRFFKLLAANSAAIDQAFLRTSYRRCRSKELRTVFALLLAQRRDVSGFPALFDSRAGDFYYASFSYPRADTTGTFSAPSFGTLIDSLFSEEMTYASLPPFDSIAIPMPFGERANILPRPQLSFVVRNYPNGDLQRLGWNIDERMLTNELYKTVRTLPKKDRVIYIDLIRKNRSRIESVMKEEVTEADANELDFSRLISKKRLKLDRKLEAAWLLAYLGDIDAAEVAMMAGNFSTQFLWMTAYPFEELAVETLELLLEYADQPVNTGKLEALRVAEGRPELDQLLKKLIEKY